MKKDNDNDDNDNGKNERQETTERKWKDSMAWTREREKRTLCREMENSEQKWRKKFETRANPGIRTDIFAARLIGLSTVDWTTVAIPIRNCRHGRPSDRICRRITRPRLVEREWSIIAISPYREVDCRLKRNPWKNNGERKREGEREGVWVGR